MPPDLLARFVPPPPLYKLPEGGIFCGVEQLIGYYSLHAHLCCSFTLNEEVFHMQFPPLAAFFHPFLQPRARPWWCV